MISFSVFVKWDDNLSQRIDDEVFMKDLLNRIHEALVEDNKSVLVHCAQGKSRSVTIAVAYLAKFGTDSKGTLTVAESLKLVQSQRRMAEPNHSFMTQLSEMEKNKVFQL